MKRLIGFGFIILLLFSCQHESLSGVVGQQFDLKPDIPNESGNIDYIWKIADLPETSELKINDIQLSEDKAQAIFIPDVKGHFALQVTVWKYNDKLGSFVYNFDITENPAEITAEQQLNDDWLNETVDEPVVVDDVEIASADETAEEIASDEIIIDPSETVSAQEEIVAEEKPVDTPTQPVSKTEVNYTVQVAAEPNADIALQKVERLIESGYDAYYNEYLTDSNQILYRIRIGKFATRSAALQAAEKIENDQGLPTWVTSY
ncbi:MAG: SPOR domain-containing protein [Candidatus Neomarinimicrobiota bacterium]